MRRTAFVAFTIGLVAVTSRALAQVDCGHPDNLCTGDPCVIPSVEVASPCVVDFGARVLVIGGTVRVPSAGTLSLAADSILVQGPIVSRKLPEDEGVANLVSLTATTTIDVDGPILLSAGRVFDAGTITLAASGDVNVRSTLSSVSTVGRATIDVSAGGLLTVAGSVKANAGSIYLSGDAGVMVERGVRARTLGAGEGFIQVTSSAGDVVVDGTLTVQGDGCGGTVHISAGDGVTVRKSIQALETTGVFPGEVLISAAAGDIVVDGPILANGFVGLTAAGTASMRRLMRIGSGTLRVEAASVDVDPRATLRADRPGFGGALRFDATGGDLQLHGALFARATGSVAFRGGIIEGAATGDVIADGRFAVAPMGCIALVAGGTLDTAGGSFDTPLVPDCPD